MSSYGAQKFQRQCHTSFVGYYLDQTDGDHLGDYWFSYFYLDIFSAIFFSTQLNVFFFMSLHASLPCRPLKWRTQHNKPFPKYSTQMENLLEKLKAQNHEILQTQIKEELQRKW